MSIKVKKPNGAVFDKIQGYSGILGSNNVSIFHPSYSELEGSVSQPSENSQVQPVNTAHQNVNYSDLTGDGEAKITLDSNNESSDIGGSASGSESGEAKLTPITYEEYTNLLKETAGTTRDREIIDARSAYEQNRATYGSTAQELSRLGLTGSGYSQYIDSQAYAGMRNDMKAADVKYSDAIRNIDGMYASYLQQKESEKNAMYTDLFKNIDSFTASDISNFGSQYGLSEEQIKSLTDKRQNISYQALMDGGYDKITLDTALSSGDIDQPRYDELLKDLQNPSGEITSETFVDSEGNLKTRDEAKALIDELKSNGVNKDIVNQLEDIYSTIYSISKENEVKFKRDGGKNKPGTAGNNFSVECDGATYRLQYSGEKADASVKKATQTLKLEDGTLFMHSGKVYIILDGEVYGVEKRNNSYEKHWTKVKELLGG